MKKYKTTGFWISLTGAILLVVQTVGESLGFKIDSTLISNIVSSVCGVLVVIGILIPTKEVEVSKTKNNVDSLKEMDSLSLEENNKENFEDENFESENNK